MSALPGWNPSFPCRTATLRCSHTRSMGCICKHTQYWRILDHIFQQELCEILAITHAAILQEVEIFGIVFFNNS
jgi:hypothetical protein